MGGEGIRRINVSQRWNEGKISTANKSEASTSLLNRVSKLWDDDRSNK